MGRSGSERIERTRTHELSGWFARSYECGQLVAERVRRRWDRMADTLVEEVAVERSVIEAVL